MSDPDNAALYALLVAAGPRDRIDRRALQAVHRAAILDRHWIALVAARFRAVYEFKLRGGRDDRLALMWHSLRRDLLGEAMPANKYRLIVASAAYRLLFARRIAELFVFWNAEADFRAAADGGDLRQIATRVWQYFLTKVGPVARDLGKPGGFLGDQWVKAMVGGACVLGFLNAMAKAGYAVDGHVTDHLVARQLVPVGLDEADRAGMSVRRLLPDDPVCWVGALIDSAAGPARSLHGLPRFHVDRHGRRSTDLSRHGVSALQLSGGRLDTSYLVQDRAGNLISGEFSNDPIEAIPFVAIWEAGDDDHTHYPPRLNGVLETVALLEAPRGERELEGIVVPFASHPNVDIYGHFVLDYLPRLVVLDRVLRGTYRVLAHRPLRDHERTLLAHFEVEAPVVTMEAGLEYRCETLVTANVGGYRLANFPMWRALVAEGRRLHPRPTGPRRERVYLSRRNQPRRQIVNEDEIEAALRAEGFEIVVPESLSVTAQIDLLNRAEIAVSPYGSQLHANMLLAGGVPKAVEIFTNKHPRHTLAMHGFLGQDVWSVRASRLGVDRFLVDVPVLAAIVRAALAAPPKSMVGPVSLG